MLQALASIVGDEHVLTDPDLVTGYVTDWTGRFTGAVKAVVRPGTTEEVCTVLAQCYQEGVAVVPQGGNTGLVGGGVPRSGEVVLSMLRLDEVTDGHDGMLTAGAGTTLSGLHRAAAGRNQFVGIDTSARDSATIGGMVATNGGGIHTVRFGRVRDQLHDVAVALVNGTHLPSILVPGNPAADLWRRVCGSEGTLAVVLSATVRTGRPAAQRLVTLVPSADRDVDALARKMMVLPGLWALEVMGGSEIELTAAMLQRRPPATAECLLLAELRGAGALDDQALTAIGDLDAVVATQPSEQEELWAFRHNLSLAVRSLGTPLTKVDVSLSLASIGQLKAALATLAGEPNAYLWGHLLTGPTGHPVVNAHINITADVQPDIVFDIVEGLGGSAVGEHGVGVMKRHRLDPEAADTAELIRLKQRFDSRGLLNPGVLVPDRGRSAEQI
ncbi:MAG: FAD-binding oxidoreductase [Acidimicrobiia bacterium]|nr:FAD-binding oxidoreductase [Acidimicrobiia bacterium]